MDNQFEHIAVNISEVRENIRKAALESGRDPGGITLLAVSKTFPKEAVLEAYRQGIEDFGENYVQEGTEKIDSLKLPVRWHFTGHLQKNKVRPVVQRFDVIQSVDSLPLLLRIDSIAAQEGRKPEVLLQINLTGEITKDGMDPALVEEVLRGAEDLKNVRIKGLMLLPPFYDNPEENRENFAALRKMAIKIDGMSMKNWENRYLSMGMTDDYPVAVSEGSSLVRVGRAIFGPRRRK